MVSLDKKYTKRIWYIALPTPPTWVLIDGKWVKIVP